MSGAELAQAMVRLAAEHRAASAPGGLERAVLAEFDAARRRRRGWRIAGAAGIAATLAAGAVLVRERPAPRPAAMGAAVVTKAAVRSDPVAEPRSDSRSAAAPPRRATVSRPSSAEEPFITIPYTVPLAPEENVTVVRMTISPSAMAAAGFPLPAIDPGSGMQADVLVGEDGRARAIRIVASSSFR